MVPLVNYKEITYYKSQTNKISSHNLIENLKQTLSLYTKFPSLFILSEQFTYFKDEKITIPEQSKVIGSEDFKKTRPKLQLKILTIDLPKIGFIEFSEPFNSERFEPKEPYRNSSKKIEKADSNKYYTFIKYRVEKQTHDSFFILFGNKYTFDDSHTQEILKDTISSLEAEFSTRNYNIIYKYPYLVITKK